MDSNMLGKVIREYTYKPIDVIDHFFEIRYLIMIWFLGFIMGLINSPSWWTFSFGLFLLICLVFHWNIRLRKENSYPVFIAFTNGLEVNNKENVKFYAWEELKSVEIEATQYEYGKSKRAGFTLCFSNNENYFVLQRIEGYLDFYALIRSKGIIGANGDLLINHNVDAYSVINN